jgi:hypothetical protein
MLGESVKGLPITRNSLYNDHVLRRFSVTLDCPDSASAGSTGLCETAGSPKVRSLLLSSGTLKRKSMRMITNSSKSRISGTKPKQ